MKLKMYFVTIASNTSDYLINLESIVNESDLPLKVIANFNDGSKMFKFISENNVDIVITEIELPGKTGLELAQEIGSPNRGCIFILLSSIQEFSYEYARIAIESGVASYILTPVEKTELERALKIAIKKLEIYELYFNAPQITKPLQVETSEVKQSMNLADEIYNFIEQNYSEPLMIADIINQFYISESYINRLLINHKHKSFKKILNEIRIKKAKEIMYNNPMMTIAEIAYAVGYNNTNYFSRIYKAYTGTSPSSERESE